MYQNEAEIGEAFSKMFGEGGIKREDIFITSKLWNTFHRADEVTRLSKRKRIYTLISFNTVLKS